jgi:hypothetical protein
MPSKSKSRTSSTITNSSKSSVASLSEPQSNSSGSTGYMLLVIIFGLIVSIFVLNWLIKVHRCKCANIEEGLYLKEWFMFFIAYQIIMALFFLFNGNVSESSGVIGFISIIISIIGFIMVVRLLLYIDKLKQIKCDCGMTKEQNIIYYYFIVVYSIALFFILFSLIGLIITYMNK